jgi:hypothetical protein
MGDVRKGMLVYALLLMAAFFFRVAVAGLLPNDESVDTQVYTQLARNVLEQGIYSHEAEPPHKPSFVHPPGYPLFLAGVYSVFGLNDNTAVSAVQAIVDTGTCALIAFIAFLWEPNEKLKRRSSIAALSLAVICPFTTIYVTTILPETLTMFLAMAMTLPATLAFRSRRQRNVLLLWLATGVVAGLAVLIRPDNGIFAAAIGLTLVVSTLARASEVNLDRKTDEILYRFARASYLIAAFALALCLALVPWAVRNFRVFHVFQPLAAAHAEMPGEFVPHGYRSWLRTWVDDGRFIGPLIWSLNVSPIKMDDIPEYAFDSAEEKQRVAALLEKYNHPVEARDSSLEERVFEEELPSSSENETDLTNESEAGNAGAEAGEQDDEIDESVPVEQSKEDTASSEASDQPVQMSPEVDAGFSRIAGERIARNPLRHYLLLPLKRAISLWFDTHSQFYPFEGDLLPLASLDREVNQQFWLPLFAALTLAYSLLGIVGAWRLWQSRLFIARQCVILAALMIFVRIGYFATLENPEPRYVVEVFPYLSILGGIAVTRAIGRIRDRSSIVDSAGLDPVIGRLEV